MHTVLWSRYNPQAFYICTIPHMHTNVRSEPCAYMELRLYMHTVLWSRYNPQAFYICTIPHMHTNVRFEPCAYMELRLYIKCTLLYCTIPECPLSLSTK